MGTCLGHCFHSNSSRRHDRCHSLYSCKPEYVQFHSVRNSRKNRSRWLRLPQSLSSLLFLKRRKECQGEASVELVESSWSFQLCDGYVGQSCIPYRHYLEPAVTHSDLEFHALDAKALLAPQCYAGICLTHENKSLHSTPPSSLDLEWEHEGSFNPRVFKDEEEDEDSTAAFSNKSKFRPHYKGLQSQKVQILSRQGSITQESSTASKEGSRMTTPDSLEWDFVDSSIPTIDQETEQLIAEIERLAANALEETGNYDVHLNADQISSNDES